MSDNVRIAVVGGGYGAKVPLPAYAALDEFEPDQPPQIGLALELIPHGFDRDSGLMRLSLREARTPLEHSSTRRETSSGSRAARLKAIWPSPGR